MGNFVAVSQESVVELYQILEFLKYDNEDYAIASRWKVHCFNKHYQALEIGEKLDEIYVMVMNILDGPPFTVEQIDKKVMFRRKLYQSFD